MSPRVRPMRTSVSKLLAAAALAALLPCAASSQEAAPPMPEDPRAPRYREVERGFYTGFEVGFLGLFKTDTADTSKFPFAGNGGGAATGILVGATVGVDVTNNLAVSLFGIGSSEAAGASYGGFSIFAVGGDLRLSIPLARDANGVDRLFAYVHGRGGPLWTRPKGLFGDTDLYLAGGPGLEYFTHLRHFSVGLAADLAYVVKVKSYGIAVGPTVRYTF